MIDEWVSVAINVKTNVGNIIRDCFYVFDKNLYYDKYGKAIRGKRGIVIAWQTM